MDSAFCAAVSGLLCITVKAAYKDGRGAGVNVFAVPDREYERVIQLIKVFWDICILKAAPQDLPASTFLLALALAAYFATGVLVASFQWSISQAIFAALLDTVLLSVLSGAVLWARQLSARYLQSLTALTGSGAVMAVAAVPLVMWQSLVGVADSGVPTLPSWLLLIWTVWNVVVVGHILRHALSTLFVLGVGLAAVYAYITFQLMKILFTD